jgi:hypothetical protein
LSAIIGAFEVLLGPARLYEALREPAGEGATGAPK